MLYLRGVSTGDFSEALVTLLGPEAKGLSASTISRLKQSWQDEHQQWSTRSLEGKRYAYLWADDVLVVIGATPEGHKELLALEDGYRVSEQSWYELLADLKARGMKETPSLTVADGALGFWAALSKVFPATKQQRCWVHKTANILNKLPKSIQKKAKADIQAIWIADTREEACKAFNRCVSRDEPKYPKAVKCLKKDRSELLAFYDFPAEHWVHIRTTNPIKSTFATVILRTAKTRGCVSRETILAMVFKLAQSAEKRWLRLRGYKLLSKVITGVKFVNGEELEKESKIASDKEAA